MLFNPLSIARAIRSYADAGPVCREELFSDGECWRHYAFHGDFSDPDPDEALRRMNAARQAGAEALRGADRVILTFGTAWVFEHDGEVVANCHRQPAAEFVRRRLRVGEIVEAFAQLIEGPLAGKEILLTVSPVRHLADGLAGNSLSKATLRVAAGELSERFESVHNYISDDNMIRKGAISATTGELCIIPLNMRDGSLICEGKGNPDWNNSAPHGAGRLMSRSEAFRQLSLDDLRHSMEGIYSETLNEKTIDEAPMAYKPKDEIIENIADTVRICNIIKPIYNFKAPE